MPVHRTKFIFRLHITIHLNQRALLALCQIRFTLKHCSRPHDLGGVQHTQHGIEHDSMLKPIELRNLNFGPQLHLLLQDMLCKCWIVTIAEVRRFTQRSPAVVLKVFCGMLRISRNGMIAGAYPGIRLSEKP